MPGQFSGSVGGFVHSVRIGRAKNDENVRKRSCSVQTILDYNFSHDRLVWERFSTRIPVNHSSWQINKNCTIFLRLWHSIKNVKFKHNSASNKAASALNYRITQKEMALAHWGFMGVAVCRPRLVGIYEQNEDTWRCFIHFWRVIGHLLGITEE